MGATSRIRPAVGLLLSIAVSAALAGAAAAWLGTGEASVGLSSNPDRPAKAPTVEDFVAALSLDPRRADDRVRLPGSGRPDAAPAAARRRPGIPSRITIPSAGSAGPVERMGVEKGRLVIPASGRAGWFEGGPRPGELGRAVIVSHVDSKAGPALFYSLLNLGRGSRISVRDRRGHVRRFAVVSRRQIRKSHFPASSVYGAAARPMLVLITCGGPFSPETGYRDNVILYARAA